MSACGSDTPTAPALDAPQVNVTASYAPPAVIQPNYVEKDGDKYLYVTSVSDEDRAKGVALGDVVMYRYLGLREGLHALEGVADNGQVYSVAECSQPCRIIKRRSSNGNVDRIPYDARSVIGSAFEDALSGKLEVSSKVGESKHDDGTEAARPDPTEQEPVSIPIAFRGEWNEDCSDPEGITRLIVEPAGLHFYESDAKITKVVVRNDRAIQLEAALSGEGETWSDLFELSLSPTGDSLTIAGLTRQRCR